MNSLSILTFAAPAAYFGAYFAVLVLPDSIRFQPRQTITDGSVTFLESSADVIINGQRHPDFHGVPFSFFRPAYHLDRQVLRPSFWQPYHRNTELSFDWLLSDGSSPPPK